MAAFLFIVFQQQKLSFNLTATESHCIRNLLLPASAHHHSGSCSRRPVFADHTYWSAQAHTEPWRQTEVAAWSRGAVPQILLYDMPGDWETNHTREEQSFPSIFLFYVLVWPLIAQSSALRVYLVGTQGLRFTVLKHQVTTVRFQGAQKEGRIVHGVSHILEKQKLPRASELFPFRCSDSSNFSLAPK